MSQNNKDKSLEKGVWQKIIDNQDILDKRVIRTHDLYNEENGEPFLAANFDNNRWHSIRFGYMVLKSATKYIRKVGAKWWKNQEPITNEQYQQYRLDFLEGQHNEDVDVLTNVSMKNIAIMQELIELEQAIEEGKPIEDIHDEYIDIIHFVISLGLEIGIKSEEQIMNLYEKKNQINHQRINEHY